MVAMMAAQDGPSDVGTLDALDAVGAGIAEAGLVVFPGRCEHCGELVRTVAGVLVDPALTFDRSGFVGFDQVAEELSSAITPEMAGSWRIRLAEPGSGPGQACLCCGSPLDMLALHEELDEYLWEGGSIEALPVMSVVGLPVSCLSDVGPAGMYDDDGLDDDLDDLDGLDEDLDGDLDEDGGSPGTSW
ncbi:MAG: hypothetical protein ACYDH5_17245 [Acidimicrobiales bacterium]